MSQYFDLSIRRIEIKKPKRDLKPVIKLQDEVNKTLLHDEYYYPTDERTIQECLDGDYILLGVYNKDKLIAASFAFEGGLFFSKPITDWMEIPGNKIMCHEFVVVDMEYRGNGIQKRFMDATLYATYRRSIIRMSTTPNSIITHLSSFSYSSIHESLLYVA